MELKPGYKQTEVGVIPEAWEVTPLGELISYTKGFPFKSIEYQSTGIRVIRVSDTTYDSIKAEDAIYVSESSASRYATWQLKEHDLVISTVGSKPPMYDSMVGKVILIDQSHENTLLNQNAVLIRDRKRRGYVQRLLLNHLRTKRYLLHIEAIYRGNANQASITLKEFFQFRIPLPSDDSEQRAIAAALSDVDGLLGGLDRLIAKKRDLKQAAMQQLLTGQTRLPGFDGEWEVKRLGEIAHIKTGSRNNEDKVEDGQYPFFVRSEVVERINSYSHNCEAILVPGEGRIGDIFHYINGRFDVHQRVYAITKFVPGISGRFIHFYLAKNFGAWAMQNTVKATVDSLRLPTFKTFEIQLPATKAEQTAIAEVLTEMDAELAALAQRREKTRALKQAMMQELLTGRTRLQGSLADLGNGHATAQEAHA